VDCSVIFGQNIAIDIKLYYFVKCATKNYCNQNEKRILHEDVYGLHKNKSLRAAGVAQVVPA
jgi:hypothetical protein